MQLLGRIAWVRRCLSTDWFDFQADIKIGLNNLLLGFEGYWRYESLYDLDYKYVLYTPLEGFKENGVIARIIYEKNIDVELSLKVAELKVLLSSFYFAYVIFPMYNEFEFWGPSLSWHYRRQKTEFSLHVFLLFLRIT